MRANYSLAVSESIRALQDYGYREVPIELRKILKALERTIKLCSYSKFSRQSGLSIEEICDYFESDLGACAYDRTKERYVIYYNDTKNNDGLTRFTIAHELGHIFLQHHNKTKTDIMLREGIAESLYKAFENEANCFARNFLSPQPLVSLITDITQDYSVQEIVEAFNISYPAAMTRRKLFNNDSFRIKAEYKEFFKTFKINYGYFCLTCGNGDIGPGQYCKICGEKDSVFIKGVNRLFYNDGFELDKHMRVVKCPLCGNEEFSPTAVHCRICGTMLFNLCEGVWDYSSRTWYNRHLNPGNARFCEDCGKPTYFKSEKFLEHWEKVKDSINSSLTPNTDDDNFVFDDYFGEVAVTDE